MKPKAYSQEFRLEALRLLETSGKSVREIEEELGLSKGILYKWRRRYQVNEAEGKLERSEARETQAVLRRLERENAILRQERDILKKALSIFSQAEK